MTVNLKEFAENNNADVIIDKDGGIALLERIVVEGIKQVRYYPDPCAFHSPEEWDQADDQTRRGWIA